MAITHHYVLCPYYISDKRKSISCEDTYRTFGSQDEKYAWMRKHCEASWESCLYAEELNEMYERIDKGADMEKELKEQKEKSMSREQKKLAIALGTAEKKIERQQKRIDELRALNDSHVREEQRLNEQKSELYKKLRRVKEELEETNKKIFEQMMSITQIYEDRLAYLIDTKCDGSLREDDVRDWAEGKEYAISIDEYADERIWKVIFKEEEEDGHEDSDLQADVQEEEVREPESAD